MTRYVVNLIALKTQNFIDLKFIVIAEFKRALKGETHTSMLGSDHSGIAGNEEYDKLAKGGSLMDASKSIISSFN